MIARYLKDGKDALDDSLRFGRALPRDLLELQELALDFDMSGRTNVVLCGRQFHSLDEHRFGPCELAGLDLRSREIHEEGGAERIVIDRQCGRAFEQADRRRKIASPQRSPPRGFQPPRCPGCQRLTVRVGASEELDILIGELEVVPDDLLELRDPVTDRSLDPRCEAFV
jgi:hypothetical protein